MSKATYIASSDIALVKYWGNKDEALRLPENGSISISLGGLDTTTTVAFEPGLTEDHITIGGEQLPAETARASQHLDRIRQLAGTTLKARVVSTNTFPKSTGLSSSASGFAALTLAAAAALKLSLSQKQLSILARQGSGSACRCVCGGFVEWFDGRNSATSYARTIFPAAHWQLADIVAVVSADSKKISSTEGHKTAHSSPFYPLRLQNIQRRLTAVRSAIADRNFIRLGELVETEVFEFHSILLTSQPRLVLWYPGTMAVIQAAEELRAAGIPAYVTINTGFNVHVLTLPKHQAAVARKIRQLPLVDKVLLAKVGAGPRVSRHHLF